MNGGSRISVKAEICVPVTFCCTSGQDSVWYHSVQGQLKNRYGWRKDCLSVGFIDGVLMGDYVETEYSFDCVLCICTVMGDWLAC